MRLLTSALVAGALMVGSANAAQITFSFFAPDNRFNEGLPGDGPISGSITYDTDLATPMNGSAFAGAFSNISINVNGVSVTADGSCSLLSCNALNQVVIGGPQDAFTSTYSGPFGATGESYGIEFVSFEIRTDFMSLFTDADNLFDALSDGDMLDLSGDYVSLIVGYDDPVSSTNSIIRGDDIELLTLSVSDDVMPAVPLPAGLPLMAAGLGAFAWMRRKS